MSGLLDILTWPFGSGGGGSSPAPAPRNLPTELSGLLGQVNNFAGANFNAQSQYNPALTQLNLGNYGSALFGTQFDPAAFYAANPGALADYQSSPEGRTPEQHAKDWLYNTGQSPSQINQYYSGGAADMTRQAYAAANPDLVNYTKGLQSVMDRLNAAAPTGVTPNGYDAATASPVIAGPASQALFSGARFSGARPTTANGGPLLNPLQRDAMANLGNVSPIQSRLNQQAMSLLNTNGGLTQGELQSAQDSARSAYADRGLLRSNSGIGAEILSTDAAQRQRLLENAQFAAGVDASGQSQLNQNRGYALNVQGQGQNLSTTNAGLLTGTSTFNAGQSNALSQFNAAQRNALSQYNAGQNNNMAQFNASLLNNTNQFNAGQLNQAGAFNAAAANNMGQFNANLAAQNLNDAWSRAMGYGGLQLSQAQNPLALAGATVGQVPDYTNSLLGYGSDLYNTNFNAASAANISGKNNQAALQGSALQAGSNAFLVAKMMMMCVPEGQRIDTPGGGVAIENIRPGTRVIGYDGFPVFVIQAHAYMEDPAAKRFVCLDLGNGATLTVCDVHKIEGRPAGELQVGDVVGNRAIKSITRHAGVRRSYDLLTADAGYRIAGVPVNSMIEEMNAVAAALKE